MKPKCKTKGLLTLVVNAKQAQLACRAAYGPVYRRGNLLYQDNANGWFEPIGAIKVAGEPPAETHEQTNSPSQENPSMGAVATLAKKAAQAVGLIDSPEVAKFRQLQSLIGTKPHVEAQLREIGQRLQAARADFQAGKADHQGLRTDFAVQNLEVDFSTTGARLARIKAAEVEIIGTCPDASLQRERRRLRDAKRQISDALGNVARRITDQEREIRILRDNIGRLEQAAETLFGRRVEQPRTEERAQLERRLRDSETILAELREEQAALIQDQTQLEADREELFSRMRTIEV